MPSEWGESFDYFRQVHERHQHLDNEFRRLCAEPCLKIPQAGDVVIVAGGFLGKGHPWIRLEALCLKVADSSVKVRFKDLVCDRVDEKWIHPQLIVDVIDGDEPENGNAK